MTPTTITTTTPLPTLESIIDDDKGRSYFAEFLKSIHNAEPIMFIEELEEYMKLRSHANRYNKATQIMKTFIESRSPRQLNLPKQLQQELEETMKDKCRVDYCPVSLFDDCSSFVMLELKEDTFQRWLKSDGFKLYTSLWNLDASRSSQDLSSSDTATFNSSSSIDFTDPLFSDYEFDLVREFYTSQTLLNTCWKSTIKKKDVEAFVSEKGVRLIPKDKKSLKMWKVVGVLPYPVETCLEAAFSTELRVKNDGSLVSTKCVDFCTSPDCKYASTITHDLYKFRTISDRDLVFAGSICMEKNDQNYKRYIVGMKTVSSKIPRTKAIRAECFGGYVFEQNNAENTETRYMECGWMDVKGWVPVWVFNWASSQRGTRYHEGLLESLMVYEQKKKQNTVLDSARFMDTLDFFMQHNKL